MELGLGTWQNKEESCAKSVKQALNMGYKHIDTAQIYENEDQVGKGIENADVSREDFFLASKVWIDQLNKEDIIKSTEESLEKLGTDYVNLMYIHWPAGEYSPEETFEGFKQLKERGLIENIGVSNFTVKQMKEAMEHAEIFANQVEMHPLLPQEELLQACKENDIELVAYSPLARGEVFSVEEIQEVAEKHGVSEAQVSLAWVIEKGATPIPKASSEDHIRDNLEALEVELDNEDIQKIDSIDREERMVDPEFGPWN
ncbi:MAG: aldo/keto reductase [Candidatus Nanohaloarchaea archaeon]